MVNKAELCRELAYKLKCSSSTAKDFINTTIELIWELLLEWKDISLIWLWKFSIVKRGAKKWVNPRTLEPLQVPWYTTVKFKVWKPLNDKVKNKYPITK